MKCHGFSLFELLFASALLFILSAFALPSFANFLERSEIESEAMQLMATIKTAREKAISDGENIVLCGKAESEQCSREWSNGYLLFTDKNSDNQFTQGIDQLLFTHAFENEALNINWRSFRRTQPIRFLPAGITWHNNGTFIMCLDNDPTLAKALFIAKTGRIEMSQDVNNDGYDEDRDGDPLSCA